MATTGQLGTAASYFPNLQLGAGSAPAPPPAPAPSQIVSPEIQGGPPMRGAPWLHRLPFTAPSSQPPAPALPLGQQTYGPPIQGGPPMRGAPWLQRGPLGIAPSPGSPIPPPPPPVPPPPPATAPTALTIPRVPDHTTTEGKDRLRRFTEGVSAIMNSLIGKGQIQRVGVASWNLIASGGGSVLSFMGRVGAIILTASDVGQALGFSPANAATLIQAGGGLAGGGPLSGNVTLGMPLQTSAGVYVSANITIDQYGRVTVAANGAGGSVTTVSVVTANGVSGVVANPTTTPAITLTLGDITPSSVAATGNVTGANLSGTNTGDQTITLAGNVIGSGTGTFATTIAAGAVTNAMLAGSIAFAKLVGSDIVLTESQVTGLVSDLNTLAAAIATKATDGLVVHLAGTENVTGSKSFAATPTFSTMTAGGVLFAGTAGILSQDNANFFWDATNHRLGLGTTTPAFELDLVHTYNGNTVFEITNTSAGSGASTALLLTVGSTFSIFGHYGTGHATSGVEHPDTCLFYTKGTGGMIIDAGAPETNVYVYTQDVQRAVITSGGDMGIGTTPLNRLHVYKNSATPAGITIDNDNATVGAGQAVDFAFAGVGTLGYLRHVYDGANWWLRIAVFNGVATEQASIDYLGNWYLLNGSVVVSAIGQGVRIKEGSNAKMGVATLVAGAVVVANTTVAATSRILLTIQSLGTVAVPKALAVTARTAGTSFSITSADATDTSVVMWLILDPS